MPYLFAWGLFCAWGFVYISWHFVSPASLVLFSEAQRSVLHISFLLSLTAGICLLPQKNYRIAARIFSPAMYLLLLLFILLPAARTPLAFALGPVMGFAAAPLLLAYVYRLNNSEKFASLLLAFGLIGLLGLGYQTVLLRGTAEAVLCALLLLAALLPVGFFQKDALPLPDAQKPRPTRITYFSLFLNFGYAASVLGVGLMVLARLPSPLRYAAGFCGVLLGCAVYFVVFARLRHSLHMTWSITFSCFFLAMFLHALWPGNAPLSVVTALLIGLSTVIGLLNMFYNVGVVGKKFGMRSHLILTMCFSSAGGGLCVLIGLYSYVLPGRGLAMFAMGTAALISVAYFVSVPVLYRSYFSEDWVEDSEYAEVGLLPRPGAQPGAPYADPALLFEDFQQRVKTLTPTELVIFEYYAEGKTSEEIRALMFIAPSTLKNHKTHMFRKLEVSNGDELMVYINLMRKCEMLETLFPVKK